VHVYERKGNRTCCDSHRGISLLCITGKVLARFLLNRLNRHVHSHSNLWDPCTTRNRGHDLHGQSSARKVLDSVINVWRFNCHASPTRKCSINDRVIPLVRIVGSAVVVKLHSSITVISTQPGCVLGRTSRTQDHSLQFGLNIHAMINDFIVFCSMLIIIVCVSESLATSRLHLLCCYRTSKNNT